jgi:Bacteriophage HK97-gp10, putative tail-component
LNSSVRIQFKGLPQLQRRLEAIEELGGFMRDLALDAISEQKRRSPVRTGNLRRSIHLGRVTSTSAETIAGANYAAFVEFGTRPHEIRPRTKRVLRWKNGTGYRYATRVNHPGTRAQPYMIPGAEAAIAGAGGLKNKIVDRWNNAV